MLEAQQAEALSQHSGKHPSPLPSLEVGWKNYPSSFLTGFAEGAGRSVPFASERLEAEKSPGLCLATQSMSG